jgi:2-dehydro-3-deoxygalactonokinase
MSAKGNVLAESRGREGMLLCARTGFAPVLRDHLTRLGTPQQTPPALICGMAGARQGWVETPDLHTPTRLDALHEGAVRVDEGADIRILPGIAQRHADLPYVIRGEETQLWACSIPVSAALSVFPARRWRWSRPLMTWAKTTGRSGSYEKQK